ncbi:MAG TPA: hypothetical protein DDZ71_02265 [Sulfuricurvum sp.]|nr:hypothetical protein [Sulfuricurvum sp.]
MGEKALIDAGYYKKDSTNPNVNQDFIGQWTGKDGVWSKEDFLNNHTAQNNAVRAFHKKNWDYLKNYHQYVGQTLNGYYITVSGILAGAHLGGWSRMKNFLESGGTNIFTDGYGTRITEYITKFANYDMSSYGTSFNSGNNIFNGGSGLDIFHAGGGNDVIDAQEGNDTVYGGSENDTLIGGDGMDVLYGESGNDTLLGFYGFGQSDAYQDKLYGGIGDDTYITGTGDIIRDEDNQGRVVYNNIDLSGEKTQVKGESYYQDANFYYEESENVLFVRTKSSTSGLGLEIQNWNSTTKEALRIKLLPSEEEGVGGEDDPEEPNPTPDPDPKYVTVSVSNAQAVESAGTMRFIISLSEVLSQDITVDLITTDGSAKNGSDYIPNKRVSVTIAAGNRSAYYEVAILNDEVQEPTENFTVAPYFAVDYSGPEQVLLSNVGVGTIYDDDDPQYITAHISSASAKEAAEHMSFTVSLSKELERDITIITSLGDVTIAAGERSGQVYRIWDNDTDIEPDETFEVTLKGHNYQGGQYQVLLVNTGTGTIIDDDPEPEPEPHPHPYDPDEPQPHDPLVLDLNQDGQISTIALEDSQVYFDITGDGVKERVGWIAPQDGFLVYDKNMNGKIEGIGEVFGKDGLSGFAELRQVADTNYDNIIDRRDALFSQLKVWQDTNGDGISQANELKSLSSAGVKNIELNVIGTNINLNGNILSEAGRYGDSTGERELAADIQLLASQRATSSGTPNTYEIDPITETLPQMRGYGFIDSSFKAYNLDPKLKELALSFMNDKETASANFGEFILRWSGFYDMAASKGISEEQFSPHLYEVPSIKLWILERFVGSTRDGWRSEVHIRENLNGGYHTQDFGNEAYIHDHFNLLMERYEAMFAIQAFYTDVFSDTHYDISIDEFVIDDSTVFTSKLTEYLNNTAVSQTDKLYLASMMNNLEGTFLHFDAASMIDSITDTTLKATITDIMDEKVHFQFAKDSGYYSYANAHVYGDDTKELININSKFSVTMDAKEGDESVILTINNIIYNNYVSNSINFLSIS